MAQLLYERHSTNIHLNTTKRHIRLCRRFSGTENLVSSIESLVNTLQEKETAIKQAKLDKESARDIVLLYDKNLDNKVKTCFERCNQYDRENPGRPVLPIVFPDGKFTTITMVSLDLEPDLTEQMVSRIESLGAEHPINELLEGIKEGISKSREALTDYYAIIKTLKSIEAEEEIAKLNLRRQYEFNYYDSMKQFGKNFAEHLFPVIYPLSKNKAEDGETDNNE